MALLNRKVDYALLVLSYLHHHPDGGCARIMAERFSLSRAFVANILKRLCRAGYVVGHRGLHGGYELHRDCLRRSLADLMDALGNAFSLAECNHDSPDECCSHYSGCPVKGPIAEVHRRLQLVLGEVTLAELFGAAAQRQPLHLVGCAD